MKQPKNIRFGLACAVGAQVMWGLFPIYIKFLDTVSAPDIVAHRIVWSFVFLIGLFGAALLYPTPLLPNPKDLAGAFANKKTVGLFALAATLIATNWLVFVWAVSRGQTLDASLGYYICPQVVVLLGVVFLRERLSPIQWGAIVMAACGVGYIMSSSTNASPETIEAGTAWASKLISVVIALSFGFYALVKKQTKLSALSGLTCETGILLFPALIFFAWGLSTAKGVVFLDSWQMNLLLLGLGPATIAPLALYATALKHVKLSTVGLLQFLGPSIQFTVGIFVLGEQFDVTRLIGFSLVWVGIGLYLYALRQTVQASPQSGDHS